MLVAQAEAVMALQQANPEHARHNRARQGSRHLPVSWTNEQSMKWITAASAALHDRLVPLCEH